MFGKDRIRIKRGTKQMERRAKIVIVEDDEEIRSELKRYLTGAGYEAAGVEEFSDAAADILKMAPDLILMDVNLPGVSGLSLCEKIRKVSQVPVIFVTANNTSMDELNCILRGGDDYISKPYQLPVLLARIGAVLRRTMKPAKEESVRQEYKGVILDTAAAYIGNGNERRELTRNEVKILSCLFRHPGEFVSRVDLIEELWDNELFIDDNTLSVNITRIRGKLREIGASDFIETRRGLGYRI